MAEFAVRYTQPILGAASAAGYLIAVPGVSVLIRQDGVACDVFADNDKTPLDNPVPTGVSPGTAGVDTTGNLTIYLEPGRGYSAVATVGATSTTFAIPDISQDFEEPISAGAVEEAMLAFGVATQAELDALSSATTTALAGKQATIPPGTYVEVAGIAARAVPYLQGLSADVANAAANKTLIQNAFNAAPAYPGTATGTRILMPPGYWPVARGLSWRPGIQWEGDSRFGSNIRMVDAGAADPLVTIDAGGTGPGVIANLGFLNPGGITNPGAAIRCERPDMIFRSLWASNLLHLFHFVNCANVEVLDSTVEGCSGAGALLDGSHLIAFSNFQSFANDRGLHVINGSYNVLVDAASKLLQNQKEGLKVEGSSHVVVHGVAASNGQETVNTYDNIAILGSPHCSVLGTVHKKETVAVTARYGISVDATSTFAYLVGNQIDAADVLTGRILDNGPSTTNFNADNIYSVPGIFRAGSFFSPNAVAILSEESAGGAGGKLTLTACNNPMTNPGPSAGKIYFRPGTAANTLKLVVIAGSAGAESVILDNIPTT